jgi:ketosteroid isomerase-like protein
MSQQNLKVVRRVFDSFVRGLEQGDPAAPFEEGLAAPDVEWRPVSGWPGPSSYVGREGWSEFMDAWRGAFDTYSVELEQLIDAGEDVVVALMHQSGTGKGSGTPVDWHFAALFELEEARVVRVQNYADAAEALDAAALREQRARRER